MTMRIAVDGVTAAGKTTFADALAHLLGGVVRIARDESWLENARERYATRYFPGETRYLEEVDPESIADLVVDTS